MLVTCGCRTGATCAPCLAAKDLTLKHVPFGSQTQTPKTKEN